MKKILLLFSLTVALSFSAKAQTSVYHPFPDSDAVWNMGYYAEVSSPLPCTESNAWSYTIQGDTSINSIIYYKLYTPYCDVSACCCVPYECGEPHSSNVYRGAFRQDTALRKVWFVPVDSITEKLLYDFSLNVGDSVYSSLCMSGTRVTSIDSVLIGNNFRKRWHFYNQEVIEGIGNLVDLLENCGGGVPSGLDISILSLNCFQQNGITLYPNSTTACDIISSVTNLSQKNISLTLSPNPFHTSATLTISDNSGIASFLAMTIYDVMGRVVQQQIVNRNSEIVNRNGLDNGLYFYQLRTDNYELIATGKFVVE